MARIRKDDIHAASWARDLVEMLMMRSGYLDHAPFSWVTVAILYGLKNDDRPRYKPISKKYGDLPLSIEIYTQELLESSFDEMKKIFLVAVLKSLIHAGYKFGCPVDVLEKAATPDAVRDLSSGLVTLD